MSRSHIGHDARCRPLPRRERRLRFERFALAIVFTWLLAAGWPGTALAQRNERSSLLDQLAGFDQPRLEAVARWTEQPTDPERLAEAAKLLYQVNRLARASLAMPPPGAAPESQPTLRRETGDAVTLRGEAIAVLTVPLPPALAEVLELRQLHRVRVRLDASSNESAATVEVLTTTIPSSWPAIVAQSERLDQPTAATGVVLQSDSQGRPLVIAAPALAWFPTAQAMASGDWALLAAEGLDVSQLETVRSLNRDPLRATEHEIFYAMLQAAGRVSRHDLPPPPQLNAAELLQQAETAVGRRLRLPCQLVRVTRVTLTNPQVRASLGADHYWQLDALGDLDNVIVRIEPATESGEPVVFQNRFPVTIVSRTLPDFLQSQLSGAAAATPQRDVLMVSRQLLVEGFFYRLWSYENTLMGSHGSGDQFAPLVMATRVIDIEPPAGDRLGVGRIGAIAAVALMLMLAATGVWAYVSARRDAAVRRRAARQEPLAWAIAEQLAEDAPPATSPPNVNSAEDPPAKPRQR